MGSYTKVESGPEPSLREAEGESPWLLQWLHGTVLELGFLNLYLSSSLMPWWFSEAIGPTALHVFHSEGAQPHSLPVFFCSRHC